MWINLVVLFICLNFAIGMVTGVEGSPLYVVQQAGECSPFPIYGEDTDPNSPTFGQQIRLAPDVDPVVGGGQFANMTEAVRGELVMPTNSTTTSDFGDGEPFDALLEPATRGWKAMETMVHIVTGGYIFDIIQHTTLSCQLDNRAFLTGSINSLGAVVDDATVNVTPNRVEEVPIDPQTVNVATAVDGIRFYRSIVVGINNLISRQDYLNQINVFPVPDGYTGSNVLNTIAGG